MSAGRESPSSTTCPAAHQLPHVYINNVTCSGFNLCGIYIEGSGSGAGFSDVRITNSTVTDNDQAGIFSAAGAWTANPAPYVLANSDIYVGHCIAYDNPGQGGNTDAGNGIQLSNVNGAVIERCLAYGNGDGNNSNTGGEGAIWADNANNVIIQYNEAYDNYGLHTDGGGFDLDGGCTNCVVQYNYSHDNTGAGYMLYEFANGQPNSGNIIRYNISQNDGRSNGYPAIELGASSDSDSINNALIYGNTVYMSPASSGTPLGMWVKRATTNVKIFDNIFYVTGGLNPVKVAEAGTGLVFAGNDYWTGSASAINFNWVGSTYNTLGTLQSATGEEKLGGSAVGLAVAPGLLNPGGGTAVNDSDNLTSMTAYQLIPSSPLIGAGVNLTAQGINAGPQDYYGNAITGTAASNIGADQSTKIVSATNPVLLTPGGPTSTIYLRKSSSGSSLDIWVNAAAPGTGTPTQVVATSAVSAVLISGGGGESVTVDFSAGNPLGADPVAFDAVGLGNSLTVIGDAGSETITISTSSIVFGTTPISYSGVQSLSVQAGSGSETLTQTAQPAATAAFSAGGNDTLNVNVGSMTLLPPSGGSGIRPQTLAALNIGANASVSLPAAGSSANRTVLTVSSLSLNATGRLDLSNNDMIVHSGNLSQITAWLAKGYSDGKWNGSSGIISSAAAGAGMTVGVESNLAAQGGSLVGSFDGQSVGSGDVLVKFTYAGDANLDGVVNGSDFSLIDNGFNSHLTGWHNGDFNYDGTVNGDDYTLIDNLINTQSVGLNVLAVSLDYVPHQSQPLPAAATPSIEPAGVVVETFDANPPGLAVPDDDQYEQAADLILDQSREINPLP